MPGTDPTHTSTLRRRYSQAMNRRFRTLATDVRKSIVDNDAFGFSDDGRVSSPVLFLQVNISALPGAFDFPTDAAKTAAFNQWLREQIDAGILEVVSRDGQEITLHNEWQNPFIRQAYIRGVTDAETQLSRFGRLAAPLDLSIGLESGVAVETLELMFTRVFEGLRGITADMSGQLSEILTQGLIDGVGPRTISRRITDRIKRISRNRAMVLARTEVIRTYAEATLDTYERNGVEGVEADVEFLTAGDSRVCQRCLALEGRLFTLQEARGVIPVHPRCLPGDTIITSSPRISAAFKRWYNGDLVIISTASGQKLACTPNHAILTCDGWLAAKLLDKSSQIIGRQSGNREMMRMANHDHMPATIEEITESFFSSSQVTTMEMPVTTKDFNGDQMGSEVYIVGSDVQLLNEINPSFIKQSSHEKFQLGDSVLFPKISLSDFTSLQKRLYTPLAGCMGCGSLKIPFLIRHQIPFDSLSFRFVPNRNIIFDQSTTNSPATDAEFFGKSVFGNTSLVATDDFTTWHSSNIRGSNPNSVTEKDVLNSSTSGSHIIRHMLNTKPSQIIYDDVTAIDTHHYSGYVYDLQTEGGYFIAENLTVSNCRCAWIAANIGESQADIAARQGRRRRATERRRELEAA